MSLLEILRVAARALMRNKTRSFLTALGIIIGVAAVIAMVAIGEGAKAKVSAAIASMGSNMLVVRSGSTTGGGARGGFGSQPTLTWEDLKAIRTELKSVKMAVPVIRSGSQILSEDQNWFCEVTGTTPEYFDIRNWPMALGTRFTDSDVDTGTKVVILGQTVVEKLFGLNADPVGRMVRIRNIPFQVVAVAAKKGQSAMGQDLDDAAIIPLRTFLAKIQGALGKFVPGGGSFFVSADPTAGNAKTTADMAAMLRERHHLRLTVEDDFNIRDMTEIANAQQESTDTLSLLLAGIALVSLLVGGIGIMNIMLVSVTERTREIGVRMAIGARQADILAQFLVEALTLAVAGGLFGVALGIMAAHVLASLGNWSVLVRSDVVMAAVLVSGGVGIGFGLYPARKAALLDPIDALRYE